VRRLVFVISFCTAANIGFAEELERQASPLSSLAWAQLDSTRARPLFSSSRRSPLPPPAPSLPPVENHKTEEPVLPPSIVLLGVVTTSDGPRAIIKANPGDKARTIQIGDEIAGWKTAEIEATKLVLVHDEQSSDFAMFNPKAIRNPVLLKPKKRSKKKSQ